MPNPQKFFEENLRLLGPTPQVQVSKDGEKYNLYSGLAELADLLSNLHKKVDDLNAKLDRLSYEVRRQAK